MTREPEDKKKTRESADERIRGPEDERQQDQSNRGQPEKNHSCTG
jgi:hypothetical protein